MPTGWRVTACPSKSLDSLALLAAYLSRLARDRAPALASPVSAPGTKPCSTTGRLRTRVARDTAAALSQDSRSFAIKFAGFPAEGGA